VTVSRGLSFREPEAYNPKFVRVFLSTTARADRMAEESGDAEVSKQGASNEQGGLKGRVAPSVGGLSDVGRVRELNEDNWFWDPLDEDLVLYAVADGMGGHDRGEVASQIAVDTLFKAARDGLSKLSGRDVPALRDLLREAVQQANRAVVAAGEANDSNMGTTLTCALIHKASDAIVANVGDSRAYLLREGKLKAVSQDHSLVAYLVQLGELTAEEARTHPSGNILVRSIGSMPEVEVDVYHVEVKQGDWIILCSDGLWGEISDADIQTILRDNGEPQAACRALVDRANEEGGRDNSTLIIARVGERP
jgi:serine/threonine protein phosphatase PrpC